MYGHRNGSKSNKLWVLENVLYTVHFNILHLRILSFSLINKWVYNLKENVDSESVATSAFCQLACCIGVDKLFWNKKKKKSLTKHLILGGNVLPEIIVILPKSHRKGIKLHHYCKKWYISIFLICRLLPQNRWKCFKEKMCMYYIHYKHILHFVMTSWFNMK